jgi:hypothetical protein
MPLWRRTKGGFPAFNGIEPNRLFEVFMNLNSEPSARDAWIFGSRYGQRKFALRLFASSTDTVRDPA